MTNIFEVKDEKGEKYCFKNDLLIFNDLKMNEDALIQVEVRENAPKSKEQQLDSLPSDAGFEEFDLGQFGNDEDMHCLNSLPSSNQRPFENLVNYNNQRDNDGKIGQ